MIDSGQLLERFRHLSREIQNGLQTSQKHLDTLKRTKDLQDVAKISNSLSQMSEAWQDFSGWVHISTLDNLEDARANCAPGRIELTSKIKRSKMRRINETSRIGVNIDTSDSCEIVIETYIPYFEQLLDLLVGNAVKYSPRTSIIEISCSRSKLGANVIIRSIGPMVFKHEMTQLGELGFRSINAQKLPLTGQGYGLYNCKRLAELLNISIDFKPDQKILYESGGVPHSNFVVSLAIPEAP